MTPAGREFTAGVREALPLVVGVAVYGAVWGAITRNNWRTTVITDEAHGFEQNRVTLRPCFQCPRLCPWDAEIGEGPHRGAIGHFNAGSEWMDTFYNLGLKGNDVLYLSERINDLAIECGHFANGAGLAFEAWEKGLLRADRTEGDPAQILTGRNFALWRHSLNWWERVV